MRVGDGGGVGNIMWVRLNPEDVLKGPVKASRTV